MLLNYRQKSESMLKLSSRAGSATCARTGTLICLASAAAFGAMAVFGKLAYDEGATVGTLLAVRFALAAALFWALVLAATGAAARSLRALTAARRRASPSRSARSATRAGRLLLRRARPHRRLAALAAALHVPGDGRRRRDRARPRARRRAPASRRLALASGGLVLVLAGAGRARSTRWAPRSAGRRARLQHLHPHERGHRRAHVGRSLLSRARLHRRGA